MPHIAHLAVQAFASLLAFFVCIAATAGANAASVRSQAPCTGPNGYCVSFNATDNIPSIRTIGFEAPGPGTATVTFHGSLYCGGSGDLTRIDLVSQILHKDNAVPDVGGPGGLRHAAGLAANLSRQWSTTFNLASTRVFNIKSAGKQRYFFKISRLLQDAGMTCFVYNATFTVLFAP